MNRLKLFRIGVVALLATAMFSLPGCQALKDVASALTSFKRLQFRLGDVNAFKVAGVDISKFSSPSNISVIDAGRLLNAFNNKKLPVSFTLNVLAKNPNDGSSSTKSTDLFIKRLGWTLSIDDRTTINGVINDRLRIPGTGQTTTIPMVMGLDLLKFFGDKGYEDLLNLAFAVGGVSGSSSRLKLTANVTVETPLGDVTYPDELTIVNAQFTNP